MKKIILNFILFLLFTVSSNSQTFTNGFAVSSYEGDVNNLGNIVYVKSVWNDADTGTAYGMYSWSFDITSTYITVSTGDISLHSSISANFTITKSVISNGVRVTIQGSSSRKYLLDNGNGSATYLTAVLSFATPSIEGSGTVTLTNNSSGTKRANSNPWTPSTQTVSDGTTTLTVTTFAQQSVIVPPTTRNASVKNNAVRRYGDINWDGVVDVSDVTSGISVVARNYNAVLVDTGGTRPFYAGNTNNNILDSVVTDISAPTGINLLDVAVLQDAVLSSQWPTYAISAISGKPLQKTSTPVSILCEISDEGSENAKLRLTFSKEVSMSGFQVYIPAANLPKAIYAHSTFPSANFVYKKNEYDMFIVLVYSQNDGEFINSAKGSIVLNIPRLTARDLEYYKPLFTVSINNRSYNAPYQISAVSGEQTIPESFNLIQNYPNPFNPNTVIRYEMMNSAHVNISVYNMLGERVKTLVSAYVTSGYYQTNWNGTNDNNQVLNSGNYIIQMITENKTKAIKVTFIK